MSIGLTLVCDLAISWSISYELRSNLSPNGWFANV